MHMLMNTYFIILHTDIGRTVCKNVFDINIKQMYTLIVRFKRK